MNKERADLMTINPHMLPKIRSAALLKACRDMPCTLNLAGFIDMPCAPENTVVGCHLPTIGKGTATKVSDLYVAAGCRLCHDLLDQRDPRGFLAASSYSADFAEQIMRAHHMTLALWVQMGVLVVPDGKIID